MDVSRFEDIAQEFERRVRAAIWCIAATVDTRGRPRTRILHPVWEGTTGWITTRPNTLKAKHIAANPQVSCGYPDPAAPVYVEATADWVTERPEMQRVWDYIKAQPEPYGFDPAFIWKQGPDTPDFGLLKLTPWRIEVQAVAGGPTAGTGVWLRRVP